MAHILGKNIPNNKNICYGLSLIHGIGLYSANIICKNIKLNPQIKIGQLNENEIVKLTNFIQNNFLVENLLKKEISSNIKHLITIRNYRGVRHNNLLPVRGQRTCSNAKTQKTLAKTRIK